MNDQKKWRFLAELNGKYVLYRLGLHLFNCIDLERLRRQRKPTPVILAELGIIRWGDMYWFYPPFARQTINRLARRRWIRLVRKKTGGLYIVVTRKGLREIERATHPSLCPHRPHGPSRKKSLAN